MYERTTASAKNHTSTDADRGSRGWTQRLSRCSTLFLKSITQSSAMNQFWDIQDIENK